MNVTREATVLLADDNRSDLDLVKFALEEKEITNPLHFVKDGVAALDFLFARGEYSDREYQGLPGLVVLDLNLPKINGLEVLARLRNNPLTQHLPVIIFSSSVDENDMVKSYEGGANCFIVKPVDFFEFASTIEGIFKFWLPD